MDELRFTPAEIAARSRELAGPVAAHALRTPLLPLAVDCGPRQVFLKLECLQPIGSFKIRGAAAALAGVESATLAAGLVTASAGNMAQGVAWVARSLALPCHVVMPRGAPTSKREAVERLGATVHEVSYDAWWQCLLDRSHPGLQGHFVHPVCDRDVIAGNGTIGLEILEDLPDVDTVVVPYGGGGLLSGVAAVIKAERPEVSVIAAEVETAAPLTAALAAGHPVPIEHHRSFVDGIGGKSVLAELWPLVRQLVDGTAVVTLAQVGAAMRTALTRSHVLTEGAGAAPLAAALSGETPPGKVVCILSGGNVDLSVLSTILRGELP